MTALNRQLAGPFAWCLALCAATASAQTTPSAKEDTVVLSPFEVKPEENRGYVAAETMTGTRVATQIKDLPYTVNVVTSEFFEDFGMFQLDDTLTQVGGMTSLDIGGGFNLRGFTSTSQLRDGFYRLGRYGQTNIDRLEIIKGPNAGIYGRTSPGGMVNMVSKAPNKKDSQELTYRFGSVDTRQATLEATGTFLSPNTSYVLIASQFNRGGDVDWFHIRENQGFLAVRHDFANGGHLLVSAEYFMQHRNAPQSAAPIITDQKGTASTADDVVTGYAKNLAKYNAFGPNSELSRSSDTFYASYDRKLGDIFSIRLGGQFFQANRWDYNQNNSWGGVTVNSATPASNLLSTRAAVPNRGLIFEDGGGFQADTVAQYKLFNGEVANKTLVTLDFNDYYRYDPTRNSIAAAALAAWNAAGSGRIVALNPDYTPVAPITYFTVGIRDGGGLGPPTRLTRRRATVAGGMIRHESHLLNDALLAYVGMRFDKVQFSELDYTTTINGVVPTLVTPNVVKRSVTQSKPNLGVLYKVKDSFRVYANYSESYFINQTDNPVDIASVEYKPETAKGYDYGIKGSLFNDRLNYTIGAYSIRRFNVSVTDNFEVVPGSGVYADVTRRDGDQKDTGWEADVNWTIDRNWSTGLSYGHVKAIYTDFGSKNFQAIGRKVQNISPENGSAYLKFTGSGALQGFSANLGVTHVAETPTESPTAGDNVQRVAGVLTVVNSTNQWKLTVPAFTLWNLGLSYRWGESAHRDHTLRVNLNNLTDQDYLKVNKNTGDRRTVYVSYTLGFSGLLSH